MLLDQLVNQACYFILYLWNGYVQLELVILDDHWDNNHSSLKWLFKVLVVKDASLKRNLQLRIEALNIIRVAGHLLNQKLSELLLNDILSAIEVKLFWLKVEILKLRLKNGGDVFDPE